MYQAFNQNPVNFTDPFGLYTDYYWEAKENKFRKKGPIDVNPADEMTRAALGQHAKNTAHNFGLVAIAQVPVVGKPFVAGYAVRQVGEGYIDAVEKRWNDVSVFDSGALKFLTRAASPFTGLFDLISSGPRNMYKAVTDPSLSGSEAGKSLMNGYNQTAWTSVAIIYGWSYYKKTRAIRKAADTIYTPYQIHIDPIAGKGPMAINTSLFKTGEPTLYGGIRNAKAFWKEWLGKYKHTLSKENIANITSRNPKSPIVDDVWIEHFPEHAPYKGEIIVHHHLDYGAIAIPLPYTVHNMIPGWGFWHTEHSGGN